MNFLRRKPSFAEFRNPVKGQLWGEFWHKHAVIHRAEATGNVVPFGATARKRGCAQ